MTRAALTHVRQYRLGQGQGAEKIGFKQGSDRFVLTLLNRAHIPIARVIDQYINAAKIFHGRGYRISYPCGIGSVVQRYMSLNEASVSNAT